MTKEYAQTSALVDDIERSLSLRDSATADTALRKLTSVMRQNNEVRRAILNELKSRSDIDLTGMIAGQQLGTFQPRGLSQFLAGGFAGGALLSGNFLLSPTILFASPRIVGEFVRALGLGATKADAIIRYVDAIKKLRDTGVITRFPFEAEQVSEASGDGSDREERTQSPERQSPQAQPPFQPQQTVDQL